MKARGFGFLAYISGVGGIMPFTLLFYFLILFCLAFSFFLQTFFSLISPF